MTTRALTACAEPEHMTNQNSLTTQQDQPIPSQALGKLGHWFSRANLYPIYTATWFRYRCYRYAFLLSVLGVVMLAVHFSLPNGLYLRPYFIWLGIATQLLLGRWISVRVIASRCRDKTKLLLVTLATCTSIGVGVVIHNLPHPNSLGYYLPATTILPDDYLEFRDGKMRIKKTTTDFERKVPKAGEDSSVEIPFYPTSVLACFYLLLMMYWGGLVDVWRYYKQKPIIELALRDEEIARYKRERNLAELRLSVLASQIEPHFLFNTLTSVRSAMVNDPERGFQMIDHLVDYLRATIPRLRSDGSTSLTSIASQLEIAHAYLALMRLRIPRLSFSIHCPEHLQQASMPPLMLISLVENAIKHGVEPKKGHVSVQIDVSEDLQHTPQRIAIRVIDDGYGFGQKSIGSGIGLSNIRERLEQMYGEHGELQICNGEQGGLIATLYFPLHDHQQRT